jgi:hypothetical protein
VRPSAAQAFASAVVPRSPKPININIYSLMMMAFKSAIEKMFLPAHRDDSRV